jgi:hypothetical protein
MINLRQIVQQVILEEKVKRDRCLRIADRKYDKPSAYKSGAVVRCRQGDIWKDLKEGKQVGVLYHYTTFEAGLKILESNQLRANPSVDSTRDNPLYSISLTRDKRFHHEHAVGFEFSPFGSAPQVRFTMDGTKISNQFKVQPYSQQGAFSKNKKGFEAEERVISGKPFTVPLSDYLISIDILVEYKKSSRKGDWLNDLHFEEYAPIRANIIKLAQGKNLPINLIINKNGDPWPDRAKPTIISKILSFFKKETNLKNLKEVVLQIIQEDESLRTWFKRKGAPGKTGGWVDCNAPIRKDDKITGYKPCGRQDGEERSKYPACRPTAAKCKDSGKGKTWGKTK